MEEMIQKLQTYAKAYDESPLGREVEGTKELLMETAAYLQSLKTQYQDGQKVYREGDDESDLIFCPHCRADVATNDDYPEMRPAHCPDCGTKLIY